MKVMKSYTLVAKVPTRIDVPVGQNYDAVNDLSIACLKRGGFLDSKGSVIRKKNNMALLNYCIPEA